MSLSTRLRKVTADDVIKEALRHPNKFIVDQARGTVSLRPQAHRMTFLEAEAEAHRRQGSALGPVAPRRLRKDFLPN